MSSDKDLNLALYCGDFTFQQDSLTKYLICGVCKMVMRNPMRLHRCGHTFCDRCIITQICHECSQPFIVKQPDLTAASLVNDTMVRCLARECTFRGSYEIYMSTHRNTCKLKQINGVQRIKKNVDDPFKPIPTVNCDVIEVADTVPPQKELSVIIQTFPQPNQHFSDIKSIVLEPNPRKIDVQSLYHVHPQNQTRVAELIRDLKHKPTAPRRCQYGKHCKLILEDGGCPYTHPEKNPRRQYELDQYANMKIVRPPNKTPQVMQDFNKHSRQDTQNFLSEFFPVQRLPQRKKQPQVQAIHKPLFKNRLSERRKGNVIEL